MTEPQASLFDVRPEHLARTTDPETSAAAARALGGRAGTMRRRLLVVFRFGSYTAEKAAELAEFGPADGAWKRISDLKNLGLIAPTGETETARSGRQQRVFAITDLGREALRGGSA